MNLSFLNELVYAVAHKKYFGLPAKENKLDIFG
jgi:hypothetical protein